MSPRHGFNLTGLRLLGSRVSPAELWFAPGLNVVSGPSDTGKTFALQCIDYLLGSGRTPKPIPEAVPYDVGLLGIVSMLDGSEYVLERGLRGGVLRLHAVSLADFPDPMPTALGAKHKSGREDTVSGFLLGLSGLYGNLVRVNKRGKTREISFRDLARLMLVDEERIITTESPIHTSQYTTRTVEESVFRLLLTGVDDSGVIEDEDEAVSRGRRNAQVEVVEQLIAELRAELVAHIEALEGGATALLKRLAEVDAQFAAASDVLSSGQNALSLAEAARKKAWGEVQRCDSRIGVLDGLLARFELLEEHYRSDLNRLEAIAEAEFVLDQFPVERCPLCGAPHDWQDHEHAGDSAELSRIRDSCLGESRRILALVADLGATVGETQRERAEVEREKAKVAAALRAATLTLREELEPHVRASAVAIREIQAQRDHLLRGVAIAERIDALEARRSEISDGPPVLPNEPNQGHTLGAAETERLCAIVEGLLRAWHYPGLTRVVFSDAEHDLVISGRPRASHGKGIRAVSHAAFIIGLLHYCVDKGHPHPNTVVLDSPLVAYREPDVPPGEQLGPEVKTSFYTSLAAGIAGGQVIVLENEDPPAGVVSGINHIQFTKGEKGRYGFIPS